MKQVISLVLNNFTNDTRVLKEAMSLNSAGYRVKVVCLHDDGLPREETLGQTDVVRIRLRTRLFPKNTVFWMLMYLEFFIKAVHLSFRGDVIHCHDLNTLSVGALIKMLRGRAVRVVYDAHEYETEKTGAGNGVVYKMTVLLERMLIRFSDRTITVSESIAAAYVEKYWIREPQVIMNCPPYHQVQKGNFLREHFNFSDDDLVFLYHGRLSRKRGIEILLETFSLMDSTGIKLVIMGYGELFELVNRYALGSDKIFFLPAVKPEQVIQYASSADFGVHLIENTCKNHYFSLPNKFFECMMAEVPILVSPMYEMKRLVEKYGLGVVTRSLTKEDLMQAIKDILDFDRESFKTRVKDFNKIYNWEIQEKKLISLYSGFYEN